MSDLRTTARPYAQAAFECACNEDTIQSWLEFLNNAGRLFGNADFAKIIKNPTVSKKQKAQLVLSCLPVAPSQLQSNFIYQLADNERLPLMGAIAELFVELRSHKLNLVMVKVSSAFPLTEQEQDNLLGHLKHLFAADVEMSILEDKSLIAGVVIRAGDKVLDYSLQGRLRCLQDALTV